MKLDRVVLAGAGAGVVGLLLGLAIGSSGRADLEARLAAQEEVTAALEGLSATVSGIETRVGAVETDLEAFGQAHAGRIDELGAQLEELGRTQAGHVEGLAQRLEGVGETLGGAVSDVGSQVSESLSGDLATLRDQVAALAARAVAQVEEAAEQVGTGAAEGEQLLVARTASFGDGAARVFLSAADRARGIARVAINGSETTELRVGEPVMVDDCELTLTGFIDGGAVIAGACGAAAAPTGSGEGTQVDVGGSAALGDGAVIVFLSGIDETAGTARVALNGTELTELTISEPVEAGDCTVTLTGVGAGSATIDAQC